MRRWLEAPDARLAACLWEDAAALRARGYTAVVVVGSLDPAPGLVPGLSYAFGPVQEGPEGTRVWDLTGVREPDAAGVECAPPAISGPHPG